jgi:MinD superfamily P-loop ATPase
VRELAVISGKGGTGKTSLLASLAVLAGRCVVADCDVDAADLHLLLEPRILQEHPFSGGKRATIAPARCTGCGDCARLCRFGAITASSPDPRPGRTRPVDGPAVAPRAPVSPYDIDPIACEGCGVCAWFCPEQAIGLEPARNGEWYLSETRCGPMVHARLGVAEENSGKLVSTVRQAARQTAARRSFDLVLVDGSPGVGCPVIASITGADLVLVVTEPTLSGLHDLGRVAELTAHFGIPALVCINKWDLNPDLGERIEADAVQRGLAVAGRVRYDRAVTRAQIQGRTVVEAPSSRGETGCVDDIRSLWEVLRRELAQGNSTPRS